MFHFRKTSGFTLVELVIAITIFALLSVTISSIYIQTTYVGQKLRHTRHLAETAREITERIADDVREKGLSWRTLTPTEYNYTYWNSIDYSGSGAEILGIGNGDDFYLYGKKNTTTTPITIDSCNNTDKADKNTHCWLYYVKNNNYVDAFNLVDSFIPEEEKKRVKIEDMKFYISGDGVTTEKKVTLVFTLALMPRVGVPASMIGQTRLHVQTTISERFFKENT